MLRSKYILFIFLFFIGTQVFASQVLCDSLSTDTIELADAEFEAWLEEYAVVNAQLDDTANVSSETMASTIGNTECVHNDSVLVPLDIVKDSVEKKDFVSLSKEGEEAREREKNELIMSVMKSFKMRSEEFGVRNESSDSTVYNPVDSVGTLYSPPVLGGVVEDREGSSDLQLLTLNTQLSTFNSPDLLLAEVDSALSTFNFQLSTQMNPLFLDWVLGSNEQGEDSREYGTWSSDSVVVEVRKGVKDYIRTTFPELYTYHKSDLPSIGELQISHITYADKKKLLLNLDTLNRGKTSQLRVDLPEVSKWSRGAKFQVHASQNYISPNWYNGGESNMAVTTYAMGYFNYDNRKGLQWDNKAEWKLGLYGMASDSLRWLRVNEDLLRLNSKLGYKAFKNFFYTAEWDFQTSLFNTFKSDTYIRTSGPFSPIRMSLSLGIDYKWKNYVSVFVSPLSYKLIYVADMSRKEGVLLEENIAHQVGITDGTRQSNQLGALLRTDFDYDFNESIGMEVHFSFFGNYVGKIKGVEVGCEIIGNFKINRFLSAKVSLYPRYDSTTVPADGGKPKMQFYELISLGFNYKL